MEIVRQNKISVPKKFTNLTTNELYEQINNCEFEHLVSIEVLKNLVGMNATFELILSFMFQNFNLMEIGDILNLDYNDDEKIIIQNEIDSNGFRELLKKILIKRDSLNII